MSGASSSGNERSSLGRKLLQSLYLLRVKNSRTSTATKGITWVLLGIRTNLEIEFTSSTEVPS